MNPTPDALRLPALRRLAVGVLSALLVGDLAAPASGAHGPAGEAAEGPATSLDAASAPGAIEASSPASLFCAVPPEAPEYYAIDLVTTKNIPGTAYTRGTADVTFRPSPFAVSVAPDGSYAYDVQVTIPGLRAPERGTYVAWVTTTQVDEIRRMGELENGRVAGEVRWNKFLVVVTLEEDPDPEAERWSGPIAFRGMSRSGKMHTMAGHGPFQEERCATYGYGN